MDKKENKVRQKAIIEIVSKQNIQDQQEIVDLLNDLYDIQTNQSVVSRDLRALGISKRLVEDRLIYVPESLDVQKEILRKAIKNILHNNSLIVVKTAPGFADMVGDYLDNCGLEIVGTIAGENAVFVVPMHEKDIKNIVKKLYALLGI